MVKVKRTFPAPDSLETEKKKVGGSYSGADVVERLKNDFHNKCYICELKDLQDPQIEHLLPHKNGKDKDRKFDWENLFWSCGHCNGVKNQSKYEGKILDCCRRDPEEAISFGLQEDNVSVRAKRDSDEEAVMTAQLVQEVFNIRNTGMRVYKSDLRMRMLQEEMNVLYAKLDAYRKNPTSKVCLRTLQVLLKRESAFAAFKRCYIREHAAEFPGLTEYIA